MVAAPPRSHGGCRGGRPRLIRTMSLSLQTVACGAPRPRKLPAPGHPEPGVDATAIHGRLGAQVALLQSPILPTAWSAYILGQDLQNLSIDKPHTRVWRVWRACPTGSGAPCASSLPWFGGFGFMAVAGLAVVNGPRWAGSCGGGVASRPLAVRRDTMPGLGIPSCTVCWAQSGLGPANWQGRFA
jgi:hypothetical protein